MDILFTSLDFTTVTRAQCMPVEPMGSAWSASFGISRKIQTASDSLTRNLIVGQTTRQSLFHMIFTQHARIKAVAQDKVKMEGLLETATFLAMVKSTGRSLSMSLTKKRTPALKVMLIVAQVLAWSLFHNGFQLWSLPVSLLFYFDEFKLHWNNKYVFYKVSCDHFSRNERAINWDMLQNCARKNSGQFICGYQTDLFATVKL